MWIFNNPSLIFNSNQYWQLEYNQEMLGHLKSTKKISLPLIFQKAQILSSSAVPVAVLQGQASYKREE